MSRDYDVHCPTCDKPEARSMQIHSEEGMTIDLIQCRDCGACYKTITRTYELKTKGTDELAWKRAEREALSWRKRWIKQ